MALCACRKRKRAEVAVESIPAGEPIADVESMPAAETSHVADASSARECAICFEGQITAVDLPCKCRVSFCMPCWDRSLVASFRSWGAARCPTCRSVVRVDVESDLEASKCRLRLSIETRDEELLSGEEDLRRLATQSRPVQLQLMHKFRDSSVPESLPDGSELPRPQCVCGKDLVRTGVLQRMRDSRCPNIICDLCDHRVRRGDVWHCENNTILHPGAFDVCERCFNQHGRTQTVADADAQAPQDEEESDAADSTIPDIEEFMNIFEEGGDVDLGDLYEEGGESEIGGLQGETDLDTSSDADDAPAHDAEIQGQ